ncbi:MAG TPA: hypothetical protein VHZ78_09935 [Rhizomicrobium sp.]|nr:hypothetical protein [Rhizomicrobium sp.]
MRHIRKAVGIAVLTASCLCAISFPAWAAPVKPPALDVARRTLVKAIAAHDWKAVADLTSFPLAVEVYQTPPRLTKAQFLKDHRKLTIFFGDGDSGLLNCVGMGQLAFQVDQKQFGGRSWFADCNGNEFYFAQRGGKWLFTAYQNINE